MIRARALARSFRTRQGSVDAVRGIDFDVAPQEIVGFLGPNGAGKTTTLRMLVTLLAPSSGEATVAGHDLLTEPQQVRRQIGYVQQRGATAPEARAGEELVDHGRLYGLSKGEARSRAERLLGQLDLDGVWDRKTASLSGGQRRRLDIALGLIHGPPLLFLDEPTAGLDPQSRANLWSHVRGLRDEHGVTVFLTTHYLDEADALCDRILVIDHGRIVAEGTPDHLKQQVSGDTIQLTASDETGAERLAHAASAFSVNGETIRQGTTIIVQVGSAAVVLAPLLRELDMAGIVLAGVEVHRPTLDDVFLALTGRALRDENAA